MEFKIVSPFSPTGDQPEAIAELTHGIKEGLPAQTLLGVTGSGKTFTMANVIEQVQKPTLILSHNKTLAAQLYSEFKNFSPKMLSNILFLITIIINPRLIFRPPIPISKKIWPSTKRSIGCGCRLHLRFCQAVKILLSCRRYRAFMVSVIPKIFIAIRSR